MTLRSLAEKYGVDKHFAHSYVDGFYEEAFRGRNVKRLLEIGVGFENLMRPFVPFYIHGASLKMWEEYFPDAEIFACDIREDTLINEGRIHSWRCDQTDYDDMYDLMKSIGEMPTDGMRLLDVIVDDGNHEPSSQIFTADLLIPFVRDGGLYVTEDCREPDRVAAALAEWNPTIHRFNKRPDDTLIVIQK